MIPDLAGQTIATIASDFALKLRTREGWRLLLAGDTTLTDADGVTRELDTEVCQDEPIQEVKHLVGRRIDAVIASAAGELTVVLGAERLRVRVGDDHEAWQLDGPRGEMVVCMPGGELAEWGPRPV